MSFVLPIPAGDYLCHVPAVANRARQTGATAKVSNPGNSEPLGNPVHKGWEALHGQMGRRLEDGADVLTVEGQFLKTQVEIVAKRYGSAEAVREFLLILGARREEVD